MHFIVTRFLRMIVNSYHFDYTINEEGKDIIVCTIIKVPYKLVKVLKSLTYKVQTGRMITENTYELIDKPIVEVIRLPGEITGVQIRFTTDTYGQKVNALDAAIREYYSRPENSLVDAINAHA